MMYVCMMYVLNQNHVFNFWPPQAAAINDDATDKGPEEGPDLLLHTHEKIWKWNRKIMTAFSALPCPPSIYLISYSFPDLTSVDRDGDTKRF